jgi:hypothetical protein
VTPELPDHPADLTAEQRRYLANLRRYAAEPPTVARLTLHSLPRLAILIAPFVGLAAWEWSAGEVWAAWFAGGVMTGLLLATALGIIRVVRFWPATAAVVNWDQLERLVGDPDRADDRP